MKNLNPCPICGGNGKIKSKVRTEKIIMYKICYVRCSKCGAKTTEFADKENAINFWNSGQVY